MAGSRDDLCVRGQARGEEDARLGVGAKLGGRRAVVHVTVSWEVNELTFNPCSRDLRCATLISLPSGSLFLPYLPSFSPTFRRLRVIDTLVTAITLRSSSHHEQMLSSANLLPSA